MQRYVVQGAIHCVGDNILRLQQQTKHAAIRYAGNSLSVDIPKNLKTMNSNFATLIGLIFG